MLSSASCRDHPRKLKEASEPHRAFGPIPRGSAAHWRARRLVPGFRECQKRFFASARPEPDLRYFSNATAS